MTAPIALVVEDNPFMAEIVNEMCLRHGFTVRFFPNVWQALGDLQTARPHVIVTDIYLPSVSGNELLRRLACSPALSKTPTAVFTAATDAKGIDPVVDQLNATVFRKPNDIMLLDGFLASVKTQLAAEP